MKILLQGYIGYQNFGDDLLFEIAINKIKDIPNISISVSITDNSIDPDYLRKFYSKLKIIRFDGKLPLLFFNQFDKVYYIGGGVFFDYKTSLSILSFFKNYSSNLIRYKIPKLLGTQFGGIGLGIGPYSNDKFFQLHKVIISSFQFLGVRDKKSFDIAKSMGVQNLYLSNDLSIGYEKLPGNVKIVNSNEIIICPRSYHHKPEFENHLYELIKFAEYLENNDFKTHWVFLQKDSVELMDKLEGKFKITVWNPFKMSIIKFIVLFKDAQVVFSSRMHSLFIAGLVDTPFVAVKLHPKLKYASELFYENPEVIDPMGDLNKYKLALEKIKTKKFKIEKLISDREVLDQLNIKFLEWLRD
ncbi:polysaccharide pyruvyl transferase family protein [Aureibaculum sp. 2210JD6-5]|uniref:polysaccharide pyruvyl transferase family protein n=1 Tax=Aureibaculum sp. 2210JD6-5 TaxID=3103957 RepID=UPI002AADD8F6|nr:polysaccharide pyruvyl transferase family protein [Aureibaculum sp. 2210JD6-5]MDY7394204.1 polysaccharide pyruvyl transferase family protein [Aureibaculum sp. 2210JD6-5]